MSITIPTTEPSEILAGDTLQWTKTLSDYLATAGYTLKYRLINAAGKIDITAAASGADHAVSVSAVLTAAYASGTYTWTSYVEKGAGETLERYTVETGTITVKPSLATQSAGLDTRSHAKKVLDAIEAVIEGRASRSDSEYSIGGRTLRNMTHDELIKMRSFYQQEYSREQAAERIVKGLASGTRILTRFK